MDCQRAWSRIKTTAAEQRQLWREVGEALLEGRNQCPGNKQFGAWCMDMGFCDIKPDTRTAAMWWATVCPAMIAELPSDITHPVALRTAYRDLEASKPPAPELDLSAPADPSLARIAAVMPVAAKVRKLAAHAAGIGPDAEAVIYWNLLLHPFTPALAAYLSYV